VEIAANYDTGSVTTTPAYTDLFESLAPTTTFKRTVCLYKLTKQASAKLGFDMCINNKREGPPTPAGACLARGKDTKASPEGCSR
jgi:hypothetical protein